LRGLSARSFDEQGEGLVCGGLGEILDDGGPARFLGGGLIGDGDGQDFVAGKEVGFVAGGFAFDGADLGKDIIGKDFWRIIGEILAKLNIVKAYTRATCDNDAICPTMQGLFADHDFHEGEHHDDTEGEQKSDHCGTDKNRDEVFFLRENEW